MADADHATQPDLDAWLQARDLRAAVEHGGQAPSVNFTTAKGPRCGTFGTGDSEIRLFLAAQGRAKLEP